MIVRIQRIGSGVIGDNYRVPFPTYTFIAEDLSTATPSHIISIPDETAPPAIKGLARASLNVSGNALQVLTNVANGIMQQWYAHLDGMYREHTGEFRHVIQ